MIGIDKFDLKGWDKQHNCMCWINKLNLVTHEAEVINSCQDIYTINFAYLDIMRRVGISDCNGEDIFEGDIVKLTGSDGIIGYVHLDRDEFIIEAKDENGWWSKINLDRYINDGKEDEEYDNRFEIIGNIYQNQELIKEKEK